MSYVALAVGVGSALYSVGSGIVKNAKAKKMAKANVRPDYKIPQSIIDNQNIAESMAGQGLSDSTLAVYQSQMNRGLSSSIDAALHGGASVNNIGDIYDAFAGRVNQLALVDENMRIANLQRLISSNSVMADATDKEWQIDKYAPYADKAQAAAALKAQGAAAIDQGVNTAFSAVGNYAMGTMYQKNIDTLYGKNTQQNQSSVPSVSGNGVVQANALFNQNMFTVPTQNVNQFSKPGYGFSPVRRVNGTNPVFVNGVWVDEYTGKIIN